MNEYFRNIPMIPFEGPYTANPFAFRFYEADRIVAGRPMRDQLQFTLQFGTAARFQLEREHALQAEMELLHKLGLQYYAFTDRAVAPEAATLRESHARFEGAVAQLHALQETYGVVLQQISADLVHHPRYLYGAATSYSPDIYSFAAAQCKKTLEAAEYLGARRFCFSGENERRDGFCVCVDDSLEQANLAQFLTMLASHAASVFRGKLAVSPAPLGSEPNAYWPNALQCLAFLRLWQLDALYQIDLPSGSNIEDLTALLSAGRSGMLHAFLPQRQVAGLTNETMLRMLALLRSGGLTDAGILLDLPLDLCARVEDYVIFCIMHMDAWACGLLMAQRLLMDRRMDHFSRNRYYEFQGSIGHALHEKRADFAMLEAHALQKGAVEATSVRAEYLETVLQSLVYRGL